MLSTESVKSYLIYMYEQDLALYNLQRLICHKNQTKPNQTKPNLSNTDNLHTVVWFSLVWIYGISTIVGHLMPNPFYTNITNMISKQTLKITF